MNGKALLIGLLALALAAPCAFAEDPPPPSHEMGPEAHELAIPFPTNWFLPDPNYDKDPYDKQAQLDIYGAKHMNPTAYPPFMFGIRLYDWGAYTPRPTFLGQKNPIMSGLMIFGDLRLAAVNGTLGLAPPAKGVGPNVTRIAARLNLEGDWQFTPTERIHALVRPLDAGGFATNAQFGGGTASGDRFTHEGNFGLKTLFFEGDLGQIVGGITNKDIPWDRPIGFGRIPIFTQNGIWIDNPIDGASVAIFTAKSSRRLDVPNYDLIVFGGFHNIQSPILPKGDTSAKLAGFAGFFDGFGGYTEYGYGYLRDSDNPDLSYHNVTAAYSRRWRGKFANSFRVIGNFGQKSAAPTANKADGALLLFESSLVRGSLTTINTLTFVPYLNLFAGFRHPQPLARAGDTGGVLKNTGINFETDGMTAYPTLTATANDAYGGAIGLENLFKLDQQLVVEVARYQPRSNNPLGAQTGLGLRYQRPITNTWIVRADAMKGWLTGQKDIYGVRLELRRKF